MPARVVPLRPPAREGRPWYRQFWPWFLIALPATSVVGSIVTLVIAVRNADSLVRPDYYNAGLRINDELALERLAAERGIRASLRLDGGGEPAVVVRVEGDGAAEADALTLELVHPTHPERNRTFELRPAAAGEFRAALGAPLAGRLWYARLTPSSGAWRLRARIAVDGGKPVPIGGVRR